MIETIPEVLQNLDKRQALILAAVGLTATAALTDLRRFEIPNWIAALLLCGGLVFVALGGLSVWVHLGIGVGVLTLGFTAYALGLLGAGDAKLLAALAVWTGPQGTIALVLTTLVFGAVLAAAWVMSRPLRAVMISIGMAIDPEPPAVVPYAVAIAAAAVPALLALWPVAVG